MANRREIVKRRKAVRNIRKICRTMQLIATARYQTAYKRAVSSKPYSEKLAEVVASLSREGAGADHPLARRPEGVERAALVIVSSSRGLAGSYNSNLLRTALEHYRERQEAGLPTDVYMVRKKGVAYFRFVGVEIHRKLMDIGDMPTFDEVEPLANHLMQRFLDGEIGAAHVAYTRFYSTSRQRPEVMQILPLEPEETEDGETGAATEYEFSPDPEKLLSTLLPASVRISLYQAFTDAAVSEQLARMVAMKAATTAAEDKIKELTQQYNRARQTAITMELLDIVGGANALA